MESFEHINVTTVPEAIRALKYYSGRAALIAGGTDLLPILKDRILRSYPKVVINIKTISGLSYIREDARGLKIGALTKLADIAASPQVASNYQGLSEAAISVATPEIRNMGTLGGNLCQQVRCWYYRYPHHMGGRIMCRRKGGRSCPAVQGDNRYHSIMGGRGCFAVCPSDMAIMLAALDAKLTLAGPAGKRSMAAEAFFDPLGNKLKSQELLTEIRISKPRKPGRQTYLKYTLRKPIDFAVVSVASFLALEDNRFTDVRIVLGGVAPYPVRAVRAEEAIKGQTIDAANAARAAAAAVHGAKPLSGNGYKVEITKALVKRAILGENP